MGLKKLGILAGSLALWYVLTGQPSNYPSSTQRYNLPDEIKVLETSLPYKTKEIKVPTGPSNGSVEEGFRVELEKIVETKNIDFSEDFEIKTDRYRLVKDDDWIPSRLVGHLLSLPRKLLFWDWDVGWGLDAEKSRAVLSMLENDKDVKDLTVRINHTEAFYDWYRMMNEDKLTERNPFLYRLVFGSLDTLINEVWAEFGRGDYYNPLTKTAVVYSNIESITAHELGHHKDFARFDTDWVYDMTRFLPPVMLYQEAAASIKARSIMSKEDKWQFNRYLVPAFLTYVLATIGAMKKIFKNEEDIE